VVPIRQFGVAIGEDIKRGIVTPIRGMLILPDDVSVQPEVAGCCTKEVWVGIVGIDQIYVYSGSFTILQASKRFYSLRHCSPSKLKPAEMAPPLVMSKKYVADVHVLSKAWATEGVITQLSQFEDPFQTALPR